MPATRCRGPRDKWLGWSDRARGAHIARIVSQDRFLLLPGVRVKHLASHALKLARQALPGAWAERHGLRPLLLETCVDRAHRGTCYHAARWRRVGRTQGCPPGHEGTVDPKRVFVLELGCWPLPPASASFAEREFGRSDLPDGRLRRRLLGLATAWQQLPGLDLPTLFPGEAERGAAYRFLHNSKAAPADILQPHREVLAERCRQQATVLLVQDTTTLNWTRLKDCTQGLGPLKERSNSARGLFVHATLAFTEGRRPLGVSGLESWARPLEEPSEEQEKESARWLRGFEQALELGRACRARGCWQWGTARATYGRCSSDRSAAGTRPACWYAPAAAASAMCWRASGTGTGGARCSTTWTSRRCWRRARSRSRRVAARTHGGGAWR